MNWHEARTEQQLREANANLRDIGDQLGELNQPPEVRAQIQAGRAEQNRVKLRGVQVVLAVIGLWVVLSLLFGEAGSSFVGRLFSLALDGIGALLVIGAVLWIGGLVLRGVRRARSLGHDE